MNQVRESSVLGQVKFELIRTQPKGGGY